MKLYLLDNGLIVGEHAKSYLYKTKIISRQIRYGRRVVALVKIRMKPGFAIADLQYVQSGDRIDTNMLKKDDILS